MRYPLQECDSDEYPVRTRLNVVDSDTTLILAVQPLTGGTLLTEQVAAELDRPLIVCTPNGEPPDELLAALIEQRVRTLNVAGPRGEEAYQSVRVFLRRLLERML